MGECACSLPPPSWRRSPPSAASPKPPPDWLPSCAGRASTSTLVMPDYGGIELAEETITDLSVPPWAGPARVRSGVHAEIGRLSVVDAPRLARSHPYLQPDGHGWPDNDLRFLTFCQAIAAIVDVTRPDVIHLNDWHTGAALAALDGSIPSVLSLHNLAYQGITDGAWLPHLGPRGWHYEWFGGTNPLTRGDRSRRRDRRRVADPRHRDPHPGRWFRPRRLRCVIAGRRSAESSTASTRRCGTRRPMRRWWRTTRRARRSSSGRSLGPPTGRRSASGPVFADDDVPLAVMVSRLTGQKGADLLVPIVPILRSIPLRLFVLGSGEADDRGGACRPRRRPSRNGSRSSTGTTTRSPTCSSVAADLLLDAEPVRAVRAAQMQAMRYGAIPVVTDVGGLHDTVVDADEDRGGTGFVAPEASSVAFTSALFRAVASPRHRAATRHALSGRGMKLDWSWSGAGRASTSRCTNGSSATLRERGTRERRQLRH